MYVRGFRVQNLGFACTFLNVNQSHAMHTCDEEERQVMPMKKLAYINAYKKKEIDKTHGCAGRFIYVFISCFCCHCLLPLYF